MAGGRVRGRGSGAVIDAVGMEAHGAGAHAAPRAFTIAVDAVRRGGTISVIGVYGVYGGTVDPVPMMTLFDKQIQLRMGQANVKRWVDDILPLLNENDPLGVHDSATHHLPLEEAAQAYKTFQETKDGMVKTLLVP